MYDTLRNQFYWLNMTMQVFQTAPQGSKMYDTLRTEFNWLNKTMQVFQIARDFRDCAQSRRTPYRHQKEMTLFRASTPLEYIAIYLLGPLMKSENGCTYILFITDRFSKLTRVVLLLSTKAPVVSNALLEH